MQWVTMDRARIVGAFSTARRQMYDGWILANPDKLERVDETIANLVMEFRSGIEANPRNKLDPDPAKLPQTCVRYCEELCTFEICMEMGAALNDGDLLSVGKAEIFLRYMYSGRFFITGGLGSAGPTPSYAATGKQGARRLCG